ncbi:MAG: universal stress protein [Planctomycetes bacterium]|nr:universal stress protein [Planctomycetota bacterium]
MSWFVKKTVVSPVDFSAESIAVVDVALDAVPEATGLHILHVLPVQIPTDPANWDPHHEQARKEAAEQSLRERFSAARYRGAQIVVMFGDPGQEITDYALRNHADMIVLPSHGRTGLKRFLIGSVAERVCRLAHCPVLVIRE